MKETIYLTISKQGVQSMRKSYMGAKKGEIVVKLNIEVNPKAFTPPVIEQWVQVNNWEKGIDIDDVKFEKNFITEEEAEIIRQKRLAKMQSILEEQGYDVKNKQDEKNI